MMYPRAHRLVKELSSMTLNKIFCLRSCKDLLSYMMANIDCNSSLEKLLPLLREKSEEVEEAFDHRYIFFVPSCLLLLPRDDNSIHPLLLCIDRNRSADADARSHKDHLHIDRSLARLLRSN